MGEAGQGGWPRWFILSSFETLSLQIVKALIHFHAIRSGVLVWPCVASPPLGQLDLDTLVFGTQAGCLNPQQEVSHAVNETGVSEADSGRQGSCLCWRTHA